MKRLKLFADDSYRDLNEQFDSWVNDNKPEIISAQFKNSEGYYRFEVLVTYDDNKNEGIEL
jgi:hypothetical protein